MYGRFDVRTAMSEQPESNPPPAASRSEKAASQPQSRIPLYETPLAFRMKPLSEKELEELRGSQRILKKCATRTPEELRIANKAWFDLGPGEATQ